MSELTQCNYCTLQRMRAETKKNNERVVLIKAKEIQGLGGMDIYVLPKGEKQLKKKYFRGWFMAIGNSCEC